MFGVMADDRLQANWFRDPKFALRSAQERVRRKSCKQAAVVWCTNGVPKMWLAYVDEFGTQKTNYWAEYTTPVTA